MKQILFLFLIVGGLSNAQVGNYSVGEIVDNFTVTDTKGVEHNLYDITASGKYVVLDFFFTTCPPCQQTQKYFNELHDKYGCNEGDVYTLSITGYPGDNNVKVDNFEAQYGGTFNHSPAISIEGGGIEVTDNFGISLYPTYCIVGPDNKLVVADIWPVSDVGTFEDAFPNDFNPEPMECTIMAVSDLIQNGFSVYPTISDGNFNVSLTEAKKSEIAVYDMSGKIVHSGSYNTQNISMGLKVASGIYIMTITVDGKTSSKKIIVKN